MKRVWLGLAFLLLAVRPASAETRSVSYSIWNTVNEFVYLRFQLPENEARRIATANIPYPSTKTVADYILPHISVTRGGKACLAIDQGQGIGQINTLAMTPGMLRYEVIFQCASAKGELVLSETAFFDKASNHINYALLQTGKGFVQHVFSMASPTWTMPSPQMPDGDSGFRYISLGFAHVFDSIDILLFLFALVLIARGRRDYRFAFGGLAAGTVATILLSSLDLFAPLSGAIASFKALMLVFTAAGLVCLGLSEMWKGFKALAVGGIILIALAYALRGLPFALAVLGLGVALISILLTPTPDKRRLTLIAASTFLFAFWDGFVLPNELSVLELTNWQLAFTLTGFGAGVLAGEIIFALAVLAAKQFLPVARELLSPERFIPDAAAAAYIGLGLFWFATGLPL